MKRNETRAGPRRGRRQPHEKKEYPTPLASLATAAVVDVVLFFFSVAAGVGVVELWRENFKFGPDKFILYG